MEPESELEARVEFANLGVEAVGWYHSHPTFAPCPSKRDIENQFNYQVWLCVCIFFVCFSSSFILFYIYRLSLYVRMDLGRFVGLSLAPTMWDRRIMSLN